VRLSVPDSYAGPQPVTWCAWPSIEWPLYPRRQAMLADLLLALGTVGCTRLRQPPWPIVVLVFWPIDMSVCRGELQYIDPTVVRLVQCQPRTVERKLGSAWAIIWAPCVCDLAALPLGGSRCSGNPGTGLSQGFPSVWHLG